MKTRLSFGTFSVQILVVSTPMKHKSFCVLFFFQIFLYDRKFQVGERKRNLRCTILSTWVRCVCKVHTPIIHLKGTSWRRIKSWRRIRLSRLRHVSKWLCCRNRCSVSSRIYIKYIAFFVVTRWLSSCYTYIHLYFVTAPRQFHETIMRKIKIADYTTYTL